MIFDCIMHSDVQYDYWFYIALGCTVWFLIEYYTRTYSIIFDWILYSDVQYDFWFYTALGRTVRFLILYCTRTYSMIFYCILHSDIQYDFWFYTNAKVKFSLIFMPCNFYECQIIHNNAVGEYRIIPYMMQF